MTDLNKFEYASISYHEKRNGDVEIFYKHLELGENSIIIASSDLQIFAKFLLAINNNHSLEKVFPNKRNYEVD